MSGLRAFFKENKAEKKTVQYAATKSLKDENGNPLLWTLRPLSTKETEAIREDCTREVPITGRPHQTRLKLDTSKYITSLIVASIEEPNLYDADLLDSYGCMKPEDLIKEMIDDPGEWNALTEFINELNHFSSLDDKVDEVKN